MRQHPSHRDTRRTRQRLTQIEQQLRIGVHARAMTIDVELDEHRHAYIGVGRGLCELPDGVEVVCDHLELRAV